MQITIEDISPVEKRVDFEVPWPDVAAKLDKAYDKLRREVRLKGFRPGKVPRQVVEKLYKTGSKTMSRARWSRWPSPRPCRKSRSRPSRRPPSTSWR
jgi:FKBP-type peptidyl-prolyl cis-trans isomerase (trigger factor)